MDKLFKVAGTVHVVVFGAMETFGIHVPPTIGTHLGLFGLIFVIALVIAEIWELVHQIQERRATKSQQEVGPKTKPRPPRGSRKRR